MLSLSLHLALVLILVFSLKPAHKERLSVYRVTLRPFSPPGGIQSADPGGSPGGASASQAAKQIKPDRSLQETKKEEKSKPDSKLEKPSKKESHPSAKTQKSTEPPKKDATGTETKSTKSLQQAIEDIHRKVALDNIQKKVTDRERGEVRKTTGASPAKQTGGGQSFSDSSQKQTGSSIRTGSGSEVGAGTGTGSGPGIGPGTRGYPIGGVPWGSPQGSSVWSSKFDDYYAMVWAKIKEEWTLPEDTQQGMTGLETIIVIIIERDGRIQKSWFEKRSGNARYDRMAMRAITKASPLPPIPTEFSDNTVEIAFRFYPD